MRQAFLRHREALRGCVLDVGCGKRPFLQLLPKRDYVGMDFAATHRPDLCGNVMQLPFRTRIFDTVIATEVLEHVPEPGAALAECHRVLKPDGVLYLTVPMTWYLHYEPHDYYRFTKYGIRHVCERAGFEVQHLERIGGFTLYLCVRLSEFLHTQLSHCLKPLKWLGMSDMRRARIATVLLLPYQLLALTAVCLFDRFSPKDARGWVALARKPGND